MQLVNNQFYKRRDGTTVKIVRHYPGVKYTWGSDLGDRYMDDGKYDQFSGHHPKDLIEAVFQTNPSPDPSRDMIEAIAARLIPAQPIPTPVAAPVASTASKHAYFITAWAEGASIQCKGPNATEWHDILSPGKSVVQWLDDCEFRFKPAEPIQVTLYMALVENDCGISLISYKPWEEKQEYFDGEVLSIKKLVVDCDTREIVSEEWTKS